MIKRSPVKTSLGDINQSAKIKRSPVKTSLGGINQSANDKEVFSKDI